MPPNDNMKDNRYSAELLGSSWRAVPGEITAIPVRLTNRVERNIVINMTVHGMPSDWVIIPEEKISLRPEQQKDVIIEVQAPGRIHNNLGQYPIQIELQADPSGPKTVLEGTLRFATHLKERRIKILTDSVQFSVAPESQLTIPVTLANEGLVDDVFKISVTGLPAAWISTANPRIQLSASDQKQVYLKIKPRLSSKYKAGRHTFTIYAKSEIDPEDEAALECVLTLEARSYFESSLSKVSTPLGENVELVVKNTGNIPESFNVVWDAGDSGLILEELQRRNLAKTSDAIQAGNHRRLRLDPGEKGVFLFNTRHRAKPLFADEVSWPYNLTVSASTEETQTHKGHVVGHGLFPSWFLTVMALVFLGAICVSGSFFYRGYTAEVSATQTSQALIQAPTQTFVAATVESERMTQTAAFNMTQAAELGQQDNDGDGLTNDQEAEWGTDPQNADTDSDGLTDGDEVGRGTDPLNPDTDDDILTDGAEVEFGIDPLNPDSDGDGLNDGQEVELGTSPLDPDTDDDGMIDSEESPPCPDPLNPDSDQDGILDDNDLDPCDSNNPSLTGTATALAATETPVPSPVATITPPPSPGIAGRILFESQRDGNSEIYLLDISTRELFRLTDNPAVDTNPVWAPDGSQFAFVSNRDGNMEVYAANIDGSNLRNLTNDSADDFEPAWSPDGDLIAFTSTRDGNPEIYTINAVDGSDPVNLTNHPANDTQPAWFADVVLVLELPQIAFTSDRDGNLEIYSITSHGTDLKNLTNHPANDFSPAGSLERELLAFTTDRDGNLEIYQMGADGGNQTNLTIHPADEQRAALSEDGNWIAFSSTRDGNDEIYVLESGGGTFRLTNSPGRDWLPDWYTE